MERTEAWLKAAVRAAVAADPGLLPGLKQRCGAVFVDVHIQAMVGLVAQEDKVVVVPETLGFDAYRLGSVQREYKFLALIGAVAAAVGFEVAKTKSAADVAVFNEMCAKLVDKERGLAFIEDLDAIEAVAFEAIRRTSFDEAFKSTLCKSVGQVIREPRSVVRGLVAGRLRKAFKHYVQYGALPADLSLIGHAKFVLPRLETIAAKLRAVSNLNRQTFIAHYNRIFVDAVEELHQAPPAPPQ